ncbi:BppU family phage baseplate upper protein [Listeria monocytogenes]|nr:BppU family phage baseplate upper protein [Listeria monocytogenes]
MSVLRKIRATLDLNKKIWNIERIEAVQGDIDSLTLAVQIVEDGKLKDLTGYKLTFAVVLPGTVNYVIDDLHFDNEKLEEGYFEYTFVKEAFSVPGVYDTARFILQNEDGTELSGMPRFTYYVEKDPLQGKVVAESYVSDFERLEALIHDVELEIDSLHTEIDKESARLNTEIEKIDAKIDTETSKLQSEADDLQQQFDSLNPEQFAQKTALDEHVNDADIHVTVTDKTNWNAKETVEGSQAKANKALNDAKVYSDNKLDNYGVWINVNLASGYSTGDSNTPQYRLVRKMTNEGMKTFAEFRGAIAGTFASTANSTVGTMPAGTRPVVTEYFAVASNNGNGGRIAFTTSGTVIQVSSTSNANPSYVALSGIKYEVGN